MSLAPPLESGSSSGWKDVLARMHQAVVQFEKEAAQRERKLMLPDAALSPVAARASGPQDSLAQLDACLKALLERSEASSRMAAEVESAMGEVEDALCRWQVAARANEESLEDWAAP